MTVAMYVPPYHVLWDSSARDYIQQDLEIQDLEISPKQHNITIRLDIDANDDEKYKTQWYEKHIELIILIVVSIFGSIIILLAYYFWKQHKLKKQLNVERQHTHIIRHPMVIAIGIEIYDQESTTDLYVDNLDGIDRDYTNIQQMCKLYNYDLYPKQCKLEWTQKEIMELLKDCAEKAADETYGYDCILFISSSHGWKHSIITSDLNFLNKDAIHRLFSVNFPSLREIPRVHIFDCCDVCIHTISDKGYIFVTVAMYAYIQYLIKGTYL
eukprot:385487_1